MKKAGAKPRKPNAVRRIMQAEERKRSNAEAAAAASPVSATVSSSRLQCPNKTSCPGSDVRDGVCHGCGVVVDDSNIVAEVQFSEGSNGAAIVQGSYFGADQGGVRPAASTAFRRVAGGGTSEARERTFREIRQLISQFARQLRIPDSLAESGFRNYKMASIDYNFVQGRQRNTVAAMCLYAACRREENCKVMLIDLADLVKYDVFQLGQDYKAFLALYPEIRLGTKPIIMEDLIFRFASRLEFGRDTNKVALAAVRIASRMRYDEMTHGRKPAGICGAAVIMAARAHNYRRTVREVVYIAKVTMHTLLARMEEFSNVPSAQLSFEEFTNQDFLEAHHDPPIAYKRSKEWQEKHPTKPKKRLIEDLRADGSEPPETDENQGREKRQRTTPPEENGGTSVPLSNIDPQLIAESVASGASAGSTKETPIMMRSPTASPERGPSASGLVTDKDGFVVPPRPVRSTNTLNEEDRAYIQIATAEGDDELRVLAGRFNDEEENNDANVDPSSEMAMAMAQGIDVPSRGAKTVRSRKGKEVQPAISMPINEEWEADEADLEEEMEAHINNPEMVSKTEDVIREQKKKDSKAHKKMLKARQAEAAAAAEKETSANTNKPSVDAATETQDPATPADTPGATPGPTPSDAATLSKVSSEEIIGEDEFKDDPEVMHCLLSEAEVRIKERIWANHNKDFMRMQQQKLFAQKMEEKNPKKTRNRRRKPRLGEGQTSPASTPGEAAANALQKRNVSMRINYDFDSEMFMSKLKGPGSIYGGVSSVGSRSAVTSRAGSLDGSEAGEEPGPSSGRSVGAGLRSPSPEAPDEEPVAGMDDGPDETFAQTEEYEEYGDGDQGEDLDPFDF